VPATAPLFLSASVVQTIPAAGAAAVPDTVVDLGPALQPPEPAGPNTPKLRFKIALHDAYSYRIWNVRVEYGAQATAASILPIQIRALRVRLGGAVVPNAATFTYLDGTLPFSTTQKQILLSTSTLVLPNQCGSALFPCGESLSLVFDLLSR
jgi:hypothetical protein